MTPTLLLPLGLAALGTILVPLLLHLARRTEQRPTDFAALRWLRQKPRPRHRPKCGGTGRWKAFPMCAGLAK